MREENGLPAADESYESEATSDFQELQDVSEIGFGSRRGNRRIGGSNKRKQHRETEEEEDEEQVDSQGADQDHEADHGPIRKILAYV